MFFLKCTKTVIVTLFIEDLTGVRRIYSFLDPRHVSMNHVNTVVLRSELREQVLMERIHFEEFLTLAVVACVALYITVCNRLL